MQAKAKSLPGEFLGIILIGSGSMWAYGKTPEDAAARAAKHTVREMRAMKWIGRREPARKWTVNVYNVKGATEWTLSHYEMVLTMADGTEKEIGVDSYHETMA